MKKALIAAMVIGLLSLGAVAYAHMWGGPGWGGRGDYGPGYGPGMMYGLDEKTLEETAELRKSLHDKMFDLREAYRKGDEARVDELSKEVEKLQDEIYAKTGKAERRGGYGRGYGFGPGACGGPWGWR